MSLSFEQLTENLLNRFECVILPDFGGFIVRDSPCNFNVAKDKIKPSTKQIFFNPHLTANDGLLYNEIQTLRACTYGEAVEWYQSTISDYKQIIEISGSKKFGNLGTFFKGNENNFWFSPSSDLNLSLETYGLQSIDVVKVIAKPNETIIEETVIEKVSKVVELADNKPIHSTEPYRMNYKAWIAAATIALLVHFVYLKVEKTDVTTNQASVLPTFEKPSQVDQVPTEPIVASIDTSSEQTQEVIDPANTTGETLSLSSAQETNSVEPIDKAIQAEEDNKQSKNDVVTTPNAESSTTVEPMFEKIARYKLEENAMAHKKDLEKKGKNCKIEFTNDMYVVLIQQ